VTHTTRRLLLIATLGCSSVGCLRILQAVGFEKEVEGLLSRRLGAAQQVACVYPGLCNELTGALAYLPVYNFGL